MRLDTEQREHTILFPPCRKSPGFKMVFF
uniref:Uncharacterized protein n=1 Tax=Anguilla anguilla TaxID=7936 RepID=A0A0E9PTG9_ANGAN